MPEGGGLVAPPPVLVFSKKPSTGRVKSYEEILLNSPNRVYRCDKYQYKILNFAIFQKLIFGIFTAIFVKNGGEKETKLDILAKILNYRKMAKFKKKFILCTAGKKQHKNVQLNLPLISAFVI